MHPPGSYHHPLRGFVVDWRPREFGSTLEPDAIEADPSAEFTSGRRGASRSMKWKDKDEDEVSSGLTATRLPNPHPAP